MSSNSDLFKRLFSDDQKAHTELDDYIYSGIDKIIEGKKDPFYTIVKSKLKEYYLFSDVVVDDHYKSKMLERLNKVYFKLSDERKFEKHFIEICIEYVKDSKNAMSKSALSFVNDINRRIPKYL